jgi:hypothetical protein
VRCYSVTSWCLNAYPRRDQAGPGGLWNARCGQGLGKNKRQTNSIHMSIPLKKNNSVIKNDKKVEQPRQQLSTGAGGNGVYHVPVSN